MFYTRFWGVRGSIPTPGPTTVHYGGNTACLEIRAGERLLIVDLGTGVKPFGDWLAANEIKKHPINADIFVTHTHWDHIMGFPMFTPIFIPGTRLKIWGSVSYDGDPLEKVIGAQLSYRYWPIRLDELSADLEYEELKQGSYDLGGGLHLSTRYLNHPTLCLGYRFEYEGKSIVTAFDTEPFYNLFSVGKDDPAYNEEAAREGERTAALENRRMLEFIKGADILVYDTSYTEQEYKAHIGWGHSSYETAIDNSLKTGVKKLICFHHEPRRGDDELAALEAGFRERYAREPLEILMAREGMTVEA
ncbi:MAG: MBL fold metallo-hydrolase [Treponema sp.]|jgi:phosphoribosyl 1,2-cyclic phosphodiesterase|nr:MBL fold metallo-hydrolase [Treponema sp.]